ncbi:MAG: M14 family metallopeptidase, partial [Gemmatimonadaceae bacterium]
MSDGAIAVPVYVTGFFRGDELEARGVLAVRAVEIELALPAGPLLVRLAAIDGLSWRGDALAIHLGDGDALSIDAAPPARAAVERLVAGALVLGELALALRGLGSRRGGPGGDHDDFFAPFLAARRKATRAATPEERVAALDAGTLRAAIDEHARAFASRSFPKREPNRRALEAELAESTAPLVTALAALALAARGFLDAGDTNRIARWREWTAAARSVFESADGCWLAMRPSFDAARRARAPRWRRWLRLASVCAAALLPCSLRAQLVTLRVTGMPAASLRRAGFDVAEVRGRDALVVAGPAERARLERLGVTVAALAPAGPRASVTGAPPAPRVYRPFGGARGIAFFLDSLARAKPLLVHLDTIGVTLEGRPLIAAKIGAADDAPSRPNVLFMATYHAREWAATEMALRLITHLAQVPAPNARVDSLVRQRDIWVIAVANPDGYEYTFSDDRLWRKNRRPNADGSFGVDLNRNHSERWAVDDIGSSPLPASETYRGPAAESEPEVRAIASFHARHPFVLALSYHTYTGLVLYPPGYLYGALPADLGIYRALAGTDAAPAVRDGFPGSNRAYYHSAPSWDLYPTNGEYTDWAYLARGTLAFTVELTSGYVNGGYYGFEFPDDETQLGEMFAENLPFALDLLDAARDPLAFSSGTTGIAAERIGLESISPQIRVRVPSGTAPTAVIAAGGTTIPAAVDRSSGGVSTARLIATTGPRPSVVTVTTGSLSKTYTLLSASGAEAGESEWIAESVGTDTERVAGARAWVTGEGTLRSPSIQVPANADSVSVLFWTKYLGNGFDVVPHGDVELSRDDGATWALAG